MFYRALIQDKYLEAFDNISKAKKMPSMDYFAHLLAQGWLVPQWFDIFNKTSPFEIYPTEEIVHIISANLPDRSVWKDGEEDVLILHLKGTFGEMCAQKDVERLKMNHTASRVIGLLPNQCSGYKRDPRFIIDKLLIDGQLLKATDIRIEPVPDIVGGYHYRVAYRLGIHLQDFSDNITLTPVEVNEIIYDCIANRSNSSSKASDALTNQPVSFRLVDPMYPTRCQTMPTEFGPMIVIRFFDFKKPPRINMLGFDSLTESQLTYAATLTHGLTLVSGGIGSGKGTTINAMALDISDTHQFSEISIDSPIEYLGDFPCVEYKSGAQLYTFVNTLKKLDMNYTFLNEIATQETAREVLNLVVSGVHVLTTLHNHRVYNIFYKLQEQLGALYTSLIPYLNYVSFQDKYSITCKSCTQEFYISHYDSDPDKHKLMEFFGLSTIKQPKGCSHCKKGIIATGIQVVSEGLLFNDSLKQKLIKIDIHEQAATLKTELLEKPNNMEEIVKLKLIAGDVLISEVLQKLDTWR